MLLFVMNSHFDDSKKILFEIAGETGGEEAIHGFIHVCAVGHHF